MKNLFFAAFSALFLFTSCYQNDNTPLDIAIFALDEPCQCADAYLSIGTYTAESIEKVNEGVAKPSRTDSCFNKLEELHDRCFGELELAVEDLASCESYLEAKELFQSIDSTLMIP